MPFFSLTVFTPKVQVSSSFPIDSSVVSFNIDSSRLGDFLLMAADVNVFLDPFNGTHVSILDCSVPIKLTHKWSVKTSTLTRANGFL